jgi:hypothetical protein
VSGTKHTPVSANHQPGPWTVTYFNPGTGRRHPIIEGVNEYTADAVVDRFGDNGDEFHRLPEVRKEFAKATGSAA